MAPVVIAGLIAAGSALASQYQSSSDDSARQAAIKKIEEQYGAEAAAIVEAQANASRENYSGVQNLLGSIDWDSDEYKTQFNKDDYNAEDYYATNRAQQVGNAARAAQGSAALGGMGRSSSAAQGIANAAVEKNEELYKDAQTAMNQDRSFDYQLAQNEAQEKLAALKNKVEAQKSIADINENISDDYYNNLIGTLNTKTNLAAQSASYANGGNDTMTTLLTGGLNKLGDLF